MDAVQSIHPSKGPFGSESVRDLGRGSVTGTTSVVPKKCERIRGLQPLGDGVFNYAVPQRLKPKPFGQPFGTAEAVPFQNDKFSRGLRRPEILHFFQGLPPAPPHFAN